MKASVLAATWELVLGYWPYIAGSPVVLVLLRAASLAIRRRPGPAPKKTGQFFEDTNLLSPPVKRPAYSDRMAYVMAEMSDLAYYGFESESDIIDKEVKNALSLDLGEEGNIRQFLVRFSAKILDGRRQGRQSLESILRNSGFSLLDVIDVDETQGFICKRTVEDEAPYLVLAFRGTEKKVSDWLTDANCIPTVQERAKVHSGFHKAFTVSKDGEGKTVLEVVNEILARPEAMDENGKQLQLFITGHSLGGALALLATKLVAPNVNGACYTFGAPRVGNYEYFRHIKTPVYRIVNSADIVPRVPPGAVVFLLRGVARAVSLVAKVTPVLAPLFDRIEDFLGKMQGYRHYGDQRYLTDVAAGRFQDVRLLLNPPVLDRLVWMWKHLATSFFVPIQSHSMHIYRRKLQHVANDRNR